MLDNPVILKVELDTRDKLKAIGKKGQTYDDIISAMLEQLEKEQGS